MSGWYTRGMLKVVDGTIDLDGVTLKLMLVKAAYTFDPAHAAVDVIAADEIAATNYAGGYGGAGRKSLTVTLQQNDAADRVDIALGDVTWTSLGGAVNDTPAAAIVLLETGGSDATSIPLAYLEFTPTPTNGGNFTLDMATLAAGGNLQIAV